MAVTVQDTVTTPAAVVAASITFSFTTTTGADGLVIGSGNTGELTSSVTFNGASATELWDNEEATGLGRESLYLLLSPAITTANIVVTWAASITGVAGAYSVTGLEQSSVANAHRTIYTANPGSGSPSITVADSAADDLVIDNCITFNATIAVGAGQTSRNEDDSIAGGSYSWGMSTESATTSNTQMTWTGGTFWRITATALVPASGASAVSPSVNDAVTLAEDVSMKMHLQNLTVNDAPTVTESVTMHMPIHLRMEKLS